MSGSGERGETAAARPTFFDPEAFPFLARARAEWRALRDEFISSAGDAFVLPDQHQEYYDGTWRRLELMVWGLRVERNLALFPRASAIVDSVPLVAHAAFYILGPHSSIAPHVGVSDRFLRTQLGLLCPGSCALRVGADVRAVEDGVMLVFDDTHEHEAWNRSGAERVVLLMDFQRPELADGGRLTAELKELRIRRLKKFPEILPHAVWADVTIDVEAREWIRDHLERLDASSYRPDVWEKFLSWTRHA